MNRMSKFLLTAAALLAVVSLQAQEKDYKYEVRLGYGGYPALDFAMAVPKYSVFWEGPSKTDPLEGLYGDYLGNIYSSGVISAEFNWIFKKWFTFSLGMSTDVLVGTIRDGVTGSNKEVMTGAAVNFLPQTRFTFVSKPVVKLYASVGLGIYACSFNNDMSILPAFQLTPIGIMVGRRVFGFAEVGVGTMYSGAMAGIGFRF